MDALQLKLNAEGNGAFLFERDLEIVAEMVISITGNELTVHHTEVTEELKGQGIAKSCSMRWWLTRAKKN